MKNFVFALLFVTAASLTTQAADKNTVTRAECLKGGGEVSDNDYRYYICEGGTHDGVITQGPATICSEKIVAAKELFGEDSQPQDESAFAEASYVALAVCSSKAQSRKWKEIQSLLKLSKKACDQYADQGLSNTARGLCYLRAAELAELMLGN